MVKKHQKMYKEDICRVCLAGKVKMYPITDSEIQELYEKVTNEKLSVNNLPETLCYICYAVFKKCYKYCKMAFQSNKLLLQYYSEGKSSTTTIERSVQYSMSAIKCLSAYDLPPISKVEVKTECSDEDKIDNYIYEESLQTDNQDDSKDTIVQDDKNQIYLVMVDSKLEAESSDDEVLLPRTEGIGKEGVSTKKRNHNQKRQRPLHSPKHTNINRKDENPKIKRKKHKRDSLKRKKEQNGEKNQDQSEKGENELDNTVLKQRITCNVCQNTFATRSSFTTHFRIHTGEKPYSCHLCDYKCRRKYNLDMHSRVHNGQKPYSCQLCDYRCSIKKNLTRHLLVHTGEKPFSCDICDRKFTQKSSLTCHKMRLHSNVRPFSCDSCDNNYVRKQDLKVHKFVHTTGKTRDKRVRCKTKPKETFYLCHICDYKCATKTVLNVHIDAHNGIKPFSCDLCDFKCTWKGTLKAHMRRHTGEKPFLCHMCDFKCAQKCNLITHIRTHTGEKAYSCNMCDYKSTQGSHMKQHKKIHTGEKGFECNLCSYKCSYKQRLDKHIMSVHKRDVKPDVEKNKDLSTTAAFPP